jgi:Ring finger domain
MANTFGQTESRADSDIQGGQNNSNISSSVRASDLSTDLKLLQPDEGHRIQTNVLSRKTKREPCPICLIPQFLNPTQEIKESRLTADFDTYQKVERLVMTPCRHVFHEECFVETFRAKPQCPLCRTDLRDMRNDQFIYEESEDDGALYLVVQQGNTQYQISFGSPEELLEFIHMDHLQRIHELMQSRGLQPGLDPLPRPHHDESISVSMSLPDSIDQIQAGTHEEPELQAERVSREPSENQEAEANELRVFIRTADGDFAVDLEPNALAQYLNMRRAQEPAFVDAEGNPVLPAPDFFPNIFALAQGGLQHFFRPALLEGQPQENDEREEDYSLHMNSEQPPMRSNSSFVHRRNYSLDNI